MIKEIKRFALCYIVTLLSFVSSKAQTTITGTVLSHEGTPQESIIITARHPADSAIVGYAFTNLKGMYTLRTNTPGDSILIVLTGFNIKTMYKTIANANTQLNWKTTEESLVLKEVQIKAQKLWGSRDTLNYLVAAYMKEHDVTIGDVLKSLPGISIDASGKISYQGVPISKFYIENMDVLQGRYNLATEGIKATDVQTVQVMERHEHVRALQDQTPPEAAALNLKLKKEKKGVWTHVLNVTGGYDDKIRYRGIWQSMYFGKKRQHVLYGSGANDGSGNNMMRSHYGGSGIASDILTDIAYPGSSPMGNSVESKNYGVSINNVVKLNDSLNFHVNAQYANSITDLSVYRRTTYLLPDGDERLLVEDMNGHYGNNAAELQVMSEKNKSRIYIKNTFDMKGIWNDNNGFVAGALSGVDQSFASHTLGLHNNFNIVYRTKNKGGFKYNSDLSFRYTPQRLTLHPGVFPDFLNDSVDYSMTSQTGKINRFASYNDFSLIADIQRRHFTVVPTASVKVEHLDIESDIEVDKSANLEAHGDMMYTNVSANVGAKFQITYLDFQLTVNTPLSLTTTILGGYSHNDKNRVKGYFNPSMSMYWKFKKYWSMDVDGRYGQSSTSWRMLYTAYVLSSYNSMQHYGGGIFDTESMSGRLKINYRNIFDQVFFYAEAGAGRSQSDIVYGSYIDKNSFATTQMEYAPHYSSNYSVRGSFRKDIDWKDLSLEVKGGYGIGKGVYLRQSVLADNTSTSYNIGGRIGLRPLLRMTVEDDIGYSFSQSKNSLGYNGTEIRHFENRINVNYTIVKSKLFLNMTERHSGITSFNGMRHFDMFDCSLRWLLKKQEIRFSIDNILNNRSYINRYESDMINSYTMYELTPRRFMVGTVFHIK